MPHVTAETIAELRRAKGRARSSAIVGGQLEVGDGGGGIFVFDTSSGDTDDGITVVQATGQSAGRWKRLVEADTIIQPALAAGETALMTPTAPSRLLVISASGNAFLCSMAAGTPGERRTLKNGGEFPIALGDEEIQTTAGVAVSAVNRFSCEGGIPYVLWPGAAVDARYDQSSSRWDIIGVWRSPSPSILPPPAIFEAQTGFSLVNGGLYLADEASGALHDAVANANLAAVGAPVYETWREEFRGISLPSGADGFAEDVLDPGAADYLAIPIFTWDTDESGLRDICAKYDAGSDAGFYLALQADGTYKVTLNDGAGPSKTTAAIGAAGVVGNVTAIGLAIDRNASLVHTLKDDVTAGTSAGAVALDISGEGSYTTTGIADLSLGLLAGALGGAIMTPLGLVVLKGTQVRGAYALGNLMHRLGLH